MKTVKLRKFSDARGYLIENTVEKLAKEAKHFFISTTYPGKVRGNHYHKYKSEWFMVIKGTCLLVVKDIMTSQTTQMRISEKDHLLVHMKPLQAHAFKNIGKSTLILLALVNVVHDKRKPDTYHYKAI